MSTDNNVSSKDQNGSSDVWVLETIEGTEEEIHNMLEQGKMVAIDNGLTFEENQQYFEQILERQEDLAESVSLFTEADIALVMSQVTCTREETIRVLKIYKGDIVDTIMYLTNKCDSDIPTCAFGEISEEDHTQEFMLQVLHQKNLFHEK